MNRCEAPPPEYNGQKNLADTPPAYFTPAPDHVGRTPEEELDDWLKNAHDGAADWAEQKSDQRDREVEQEAADAANRAQEEAGAKGVDLNADEIKIGRASCRERV